MKSKIKEEEKDCFSEKKNVKNDIIYIYIYIYIYINWSFFYYIISYLT